MLIKPPTSSIKALLAIREYEVRTVILYLFDSGMSCLTASALTKGLMTISWLFFSMPSSTLYAFSKKLVAGLLRVMFPAAMVTIQSFGFSLNHTMFIVITPYTFIIRLIIEIAIVIIKNYFYLFSSIDIS